MAREETIRLRLDTSDLLRGQRATQQAFVNVNATLQGTDRIVRTLEGGFDRLSGDIRRLNTQIPQTNRGVNALTRGIQALGGVLLVRQVAAYTDAWTRYTNQVRLTAQSTEQLAERQQQLFQIAQQNRAPIEELARLYNRVSQSQTELGASSREIRTLLTAVGQSLAISGTTAQEARGSLIQLSQALGAGIVRAEEFNSILEGTPRIARAVASGLGTTVAGLRRLVIAGQLTSRQFFDALISQSGILADEFATTTATISQGIVRIQNSLTRFVGRFNEVTGVSAVLGSGLASLSGIIDTLSENAEILGTVVTRTGAAIAAAFVAGIVVRNIGRITSAIETVRIALLIAATDAAALSTALGGLPVVIAGITTFAITTLVLELNRAEEAADRAAEAFDGLARARERASDERIVSGRLGGQLTDIVPRLQARIEELNAEIARTEAGTGLTPSGRFQIGRTQEEERQLQSLIDARDRYQRLLEREERLNETVEEQQRRQLELQRIASSEFEANERDRAARTARIAREQEEEIARGREIREGLREVVEQGSQSQQILSRADREAAQLQESVANQLRQSVSLGAAAAQVLRDTFVDAITGTERQQLESARRLIQFSESNSFFRNFFALNPEDRNQLVENINQTGQEALQSSIQINRQRIANERQFLRQRAQLSRQFLRTQVQEGRQAEQRLNSIREEGLSVSEEIIQSLQAQANEGQIALDLLQRAYSQTLNTTQEQIIAVYSELLDQISENPLFETALTISPEAQQQAVRRILQTADTAVSASRDTNRRIEREERRSLRIRQTEQERFYENVNNFFQSQLEILFTDSEDGARRVFDNILNMARRSLAQIANERIFVPIFTQLVGGGATATGQVVSGGAGQVGVNNQQTNLVSNAISGGQNFAVNRIIGTQISDAFLDNVGVRLGFAGTVQGTRGSTAYTPGRFGGVRLSEAAPSIVGGLTSAAGAFQSFAEGNVGAGVYRTLNAALYTNPVTLPFAVALSVLDSFGLTSLFGADTPNALRAGLTFTGVRRDPITGRFETTGESPLTLAGEADAIGDFTFAERRGSGGGQQQAVAALDAAVRSTLDSYTNLLNSAAQTLGEEGIEILRDRDFAFNLSEAITTTERRLGTSAVARRTEDFIREINQEIFQNIAPDLIEIQGRAVDQLSEEYADVLAVLGDDATERFNRAIEGIQEIDPIGESDEQVQIFGQNINVVQGLRSELGSIGQLTRAFDEIVRTENFSQLQLQLEQVNDRYDDAADTLRRLGVEIESTNLERARSIEIERTQRASLEELGVSSLEASLSSLRTTVSGLINDTTAAQDSFLELRRAFDIRDDSPESIANIVTLFNQSYSTAINEAIQSAQNFSSAQRQAAESSERLVTSINERLAELATFSRLNVALPSTRFSEAQSQYRELLESARTGGVDQIDNFLNFVEPFLNLGQEVLKSSPAFQALFGSVQADLASLGIEAGSDEFRRNETNRILEEINERQSLDPEARSFLESQITTINNRFQPIINHLADVVTNIEALGPEIANAIRQIQLPTPTTPTPGTGIPPTPTTPGELEDSLIARQNRFIASESSRLGLSEDVVRTNYENVGGLSDAFLAARGFQEGGLSRGPVGGYLQLLHGNEFVTPEGRFDDVIDAAIDSARNSQQSISDFSGIEIAIDRLSSRVDELSSLTNQGNAEREMQTETIRRTAIDPNQLSGSMQNVARTEIRRNELVGGFVS